MKKFKLLACLLFVAVLLTGCTKKEETNDTPKEDTPVSGGWTVATDTKYKEGIPDKAKKAFDNAKKDYEGLDLELVGLLGTQVVSGTNYMFIAKGTTVTNEPTTDWKIVIVYEDAKGKAEINSVEDFNFVDYANNDIQFEDKNITGGWTVNSKEVKVTLNKDAEAIFEDAIKEYSGVKLSKIAYLGSQVVSGTNHAYLALATTTTKDAKNYIAVVTAYKDLDNKTEISTVSYVDLAKFNN